MGPCRAAAYLCFLLLMMLKDPIFLKTDFYVKKDEKSNKNTKFEIKLGEKQKKTGFFWNQYFFPNLTNFLTSNVQKYTKHHVLVQIIIFWNFIEIGDVRVQNCVGNWWNGPYICISSGEHQDIHAPGNRKKNPPKRSSSWRESRTHPLQHPHWCAYILGHRSSQLKSWKSVLSEVLTWFGKLQL